MALLQRELVAVQALILAIINLVNVFGWVHWTPDQLAAINTILAVVLGGIVRSAVTPAAKAP